MKMVKEQPKFFYTRGYTKENLKLAVQKVLNEKISIRSVALKYKIPRMTLHRYLQKAKNVKDLDKVIFESRNDHLRVFQKTDEVLLRDFFLYASKINLGLSIKEGRRFVYEFAIAKGLQPNSKWQEDKMASYDWFHGFMKRHRLSLQSPEQASRTCVANVDVFFEKLRGVLQRYQMKVQNLYQRSGLNGLNKIKVIAQA